MKDALGYDLRPDDYVVYSAGDYNNLKVGRVTAITPKRVKLEIYYRNYNGSITKRQKIICPDQVCIINREQIPQKYINEYENE